MQNLILLKIDTSLMSFKNNYQWTSSEKTSNTRKSALLMQRGKKWLCLLAGSLWRYLMFFWWPRTEATEGCKALGLDKHYTLGSITALRGADKRDWLHVGYLFKISHIVNSALICNSQEMLTIWKATFLSLALAETINMGKLAYPKQHYSVRLHM